MPHSSEAWVGNFVLDLQARKLPHPTKISRITLLRKTRCFEVAHICAAKGGANVGLLSGVPHASEAWVGNFVFIRQARKLPHPTKIG